MPKTSKLGPARLRRRGKVHLRVTLKFRRRRSADADRAVVQDALIRTHGYKTIRGLTSALARQLGRFRCYIAKSALPGLLRRLKRLVADGDVCLWIGGQRMTA